MNYKRRLKRSLEQIETPSMEKILGTTSQKSNFESRNNKKIGRFAFAPALSIILCVALLVGTAAVGIPMIVNYFNARVISENNVQLDTVPEGYIGIYTAEDLDSVRHSKGKNYILMNDIEFSDEDFLLGGRFEGGWIPIGSEKEQDGHFVGIFNGNGYVIRNVKIAPSTLVGEAYFGIFGKTSGQFINLGVEGIEINVDFHDANFYSYGDGEYVFVGGIAANADFIGGCYVEDAKIKVSLENYFHGEEWLKTWQKYNNHYGRPSLFVGGIAGVADYMDSCISYADISVVGETDFSVYAGLCTGESFSCLTSLSIGNIEVDGEMCYSVITDDISTNTGAMSIPMILTERAMETITQKFTEVFDRGQGSFELAKFRAHYMKFSSGEEKIESRELYEKYIKINKTFGYLNFGDTEYTGDLYVLDEAASIGSYTVSLAAYVLEVFDGYEDFIYFCNANNIKCGVLDCYSFENKEDIDASVLENFDFKNIFTKKNGEVKLRIFAR